jgi:serine-type D-Ala-D-Ala carboxypeptidase/endopeptidase
MKDTAIALSPDQQRRFIAGHTQDLRAAHAWDLDSLAGAGAIRSTAADMLLYLQAQLHPERDGRSLSAALKRTHELVADVWPGARIGYGWIFENKSGTYFHNGGTGGFSSFAFFNPKADYAAVVLVNVAVGARGSFADQLAKHIGQRLAGEPAVSLDQW